MPVDAGTIYSEVRVKLDRLKGDISAIEGSFNKMGTQITGGMNTVDKNVSKSFSNINLAGVAAFAGITLAVKSSIKTFATFEQSLLNVKSVSGATADEFQKIEDAARQAGETTRFTASEAADALYYLASAGFDATQSVSALDGVLTLAGATQSDLAFTSETVASAISQFDLAAEDSIRVANVFAASIANSQATMEKLAVSMRYVGPVASAMGKSIEEVSGLLQILYNAGFEASQAGTALRSALADLSNESSPAVAKLRKLGVSFEQVNPQTNSFADIIGVLNEKVTDAGDIMQVFGDRAGPALIKLIQGGREEIEKYTDAVTGTNAAAEAYKIQNEGLLASFDFLKSASQEASISLTEDMAPVLQFVTELITKFIKAISNMPAPLKVLLATLTGGIVVFTGVAMAVNFLSTALTGLSLTIVSTVGPIGAALLGVGAAIGAVNSHLKEVDASNTIDELIKVRDEGVKATAAVKSLQNRLELIGTTAEGLKELSKETGLTSKEIVKLSRTIKSGFDLSSIDGLQKGLEVLAKSSGVSEQSLLKIIVYTDKFSKDVKDIASGLLEQNNELEKQEEHKKNIAVSNNEILTQNEKINELEKNINAAVAAGILSEEEGLNQKIKLRQEIIDKLQQEAIEEGNTGKVVQGELSKNLEALQGYKTELANVEGTKKAEAELAKYQQRVNELNQVTRTSIDIEQERAEELIKGLGLSEDELEKVLQKLRELFKELKKDEASKTFKENLTNTITTSLSGIGQLFGALDSLQQAVAQKRIEALNAELDAQLEAIDQQTQAKLEALGLVEETELETLQRQLEEALAIGDESTANEIQNNITKLEIEKQADEEKAAIQEAAAKREAQIEYQAELQSWKLTLAQTVANGIGAVIASYNNAGGFPWGVAPAAIMTGIYTTMLKTVQKNKPTPPQMAEGGIILPRSGGTVVEAAENGYPEAMINYGPSGKPMIAELARMIVNAMGGTGGNMTIINELDGLKLSQAVVKYINNGNVRVKL